MPKENATSPEAQLAAMLAATAEPDTRNSLSVEEVRKSFSEYLAFHADEVRELPGEAAQPHWNLVMAEGDFDRAALFVAAVWIGEQVTLCCGFGSARDVRSFCECDFPENAADVVPTLRSRFRVQHEVVTLPKEKFERWLYSGES